MKNIELSEKLESIYGSIKNEPVRVPYSAFMVHRRKFIPERMSDKKILNKINDLKLEPNEVASDEDLEFYNQSLKIYKEFKNWYPKFLSSIENAFDEKSIVRLEEKFFDKTWLAYFFDNRSRSKVKLAQIIVNIGKEGTVTINNINDQQSEKYEGSFRLHRKRYLIFELRGVNRMDKPLFIEIITGPIPTDISIGSYITIEQDSIVTGTILFKKINKKYENISEKSGLFSFLDNETEFINIDEEIREFLCRKEYNYNKVPKDIFTINDLRELKLNYNRDKKSLFFDVKNPIVFIASPCNAISDTEYEKSKNLILEVKGKIENRAPKTIVLYPGENKESLFGISAYLKNLDRLTRTHFFVFIQLDNGGFTSGSSSLIELGWALAYCKSIIFFYKKKDLIPSVISHLNNSPKLNRFQSYQIPSNSNDQQFIYETIINEINLALNLNLEKGPI